MSMIKSVRVLCAMYDKTTVQLAKHMRMTRTGLFYMLRDERKYRLQEILEFFNVSEEEFNHWSDL
jgi:hypothetical protein